VRRNAEKVRKEPVMIRLTRVLALATIACVVAAMAPGAFAASRATYYVSVGDSLAQGYQPIGGPLSALGMAFQAQIDALSAVLGGVYAAAGFPVADVAGAFQVDDTTLLDGIPGQRAP
jgi:hypothetical protein